MVTIVSEDQYTKILLSNRLMRYIRILDSSAISHGMGDRVKYPDLQLSGDRKTLLFEGHIEKDGKVSLADWPYPKAAAETAVS